MKPFSAALLVFFLVALPGPHPLAANIRISGILPGGGLIHKQVKSIVERRYDNLIRQKLDFSCGAAALATILKYSYGMDITEEGVVRGLMSVSDPKIARARGFSMLNIKNYLAKLGMRGRGYRVDPTMLLKVKVPTLALLDIKGYKHFVVLKKPTRDDMYIADPALGNRIMSRNEFLEAWQESGVIFAVIGEGYDKENILLKSARRLTDYQLAETFKPITDAELLDFGFSHAELHRF